MTNNLIAFDHTAEQNNHIQQLVNEIQKLRQDNATLTAITLRLRATDLTPADIAQSLIAGCPQWPGHLVLCHSLEYTRIPLYACVMLLSKSSTGRLGMEYSRELSGKENK